MTNAIYLDYAATTPVDESVISHMLQFMGRGGHFGNPASRSHGYGWLAEEGVEDARRAVAEVLHADVREIVFTSGATEANNLAIKGAAEAEPSRRHIITSAIEHKAVLDTVHWCEQQGFRVTLLPPQADGSIAVETLRQALTADTFLVSIMHANNETGVINDIAALGALAREAGALFHVDAAQTVGKLPLDMRQLPVDLLSLSGHKFYGPKGIGALYVRRHPAVNIAPQIHGGGHERGYRSGTLPSHQIVGLGAALQLAAENADEENARITRLRDYFWQQLSQALDVQRNGSGECLPGHLNVMFRGLDGDWLLSALPKIAISSGSACTSASVEPSHVLMAMGCSRQHALSSLRFSLGRYTSEQDIEQTVEHLVSVIRPMQAAARGG